MAEQNRTRSVLTEVVVGIFVAVVAGLIVWKITIPQSSSSVPPSSTAISQKVPTETRAETPRSPAETQNYQQNRTQPKSSLSTNTGAYQQPTSKGTLPTREEAPPAEAKLEPPAPKQETPLTNRTVVAYPFGSWRGIMNQAGLPPYSVLQVLDHSGGGRFSLEPLNCGGTLTLKESHDKAFFYSYEYDYGRNCYRGGTIKMQIRDEDNLDVTLFSLTGEPVSSGTLHRIDK